MYLSLLHCNLVPPLFCVTKERGKGRRDRSKDGAWWLTTTESLFISLPFFLAIASVLAHSSATIVSYKLRRRRGKRKRKGEPAGGEVVANGGHHVTSLSLSFSLAQSVSLVYMKMEARSVSCYGFLKKIVTLIVMVGGTCVMLLQAPLVYYFS